MQFRVAVPFTLVDVVLTPLLTVICKFTGAVAVTVTVPEATQVALPVLPLIVAIALFEVFQLRPPELDQCSLAAHATVVTVRVWDYPLSANSGSGLLRGACAFVAGCEIVQSFIKELIQQTEKLHLRKQFDGFSHDPLILQERP